MNKITLISEEGREPETEAQPEHTHPKLEQHRPNRLSVSKVISENEKWRECKIMGKNVSIRSYSAACSFRGLFYMYGGYQILRGMMDDFYSIDLSDSVEKFDWVSIEAGGHKPGPRSKHALVATKDRILLIGGLESDMRVCNEIYSYDVDQKKWSLVKPTG